MRDRWIAPGGSTYRTVKEAAKDGFKRAQLIRESQLMAYINTVKEEPKMEEAKTLVPISFALPAVQGDGMGQAFAEEMDGLPLNFDRVKIPSGGGLAFEVPGENAESPDVVKEIVGVIIDHHPLNAYWSEQYSGQNNPPDCASMDNKTGVLRDTGECRACATCPQNQWGTEIKPNGSRGKGKACKNMHRLYLLRNGEMMPLLLTLSPTSLKNLSDYLAKRVVSKGYRSFQVLTKVTLRKATSSDGIVYSQAAFSLVEVLDEATAQQATALAERIRPLTRSLAIQNDEYTFSETVPSSNSQNDSDEDNNDLPF